MKSSSANRTTINLLVKQMATALKIRSDPNLSLAEEGTGVRVFTPRDRSGTSASNVSRSSSPATIDNRDYEQLSEREQARISFGVGRRKTKKGRKTKRSRKTKKSSKRRTK